MADIYDVAQASWVTGVATFRQSYGVSVSANVNMSILEAKIFLKALTTTIEFAETLNATLKENLNE